MPERRIVTVLDPVDEYTHIPDPVANYNESMYLNAFDLGAEVGGWFRLGNRVNEGYAEMTVCVYLEGGRVAFVYGRPEISHNDEMRAGGLHIEVIEPFEHLRVAYEGKVCVLDEPRSMTDPRAAFEANPWVECTIELDIRGISPMYGGKPVYDDGTEIELDAANSFAKAHYEQHCATSGSIRVGDEVLDIAGFGLRDKSWGPRHWQAISYYRWLPFVFGSDFAMMVSDVGGRRGGMVLVGDEYHEIRSATIDTVWDDDSYHREMRCRVETDARDYEVTGEVISLIPLRNRRRDDTGEMLVTRITEAMTRFECDGRTGIGMSEYLDQIVDGRPVGPDIAGGAARR